MGMRKKVLIGAGIAVGILVCVYGGITIYFSSHFYRGTTINGVDFSMKNEQDAQKYFEKQIHGYTLTVKPKEGDSEQISGSEISIKYKPSKEIKAALKKQNAFLWPSMFGGDQKILVDLGFDYEQENLEAKIQGLQSFQNEGKIDPVNAKPEYDGNQYTIKAEALGTKVDQEIMKEAIKGAVQRLEGQIELEKEHCYLKPKYTKESKEVMTANDTLNQYCKASITYDMAPQKEVVDKQLISTWLTCDENMAVTFHEDKAREYMRSFGAKYDTFGKTRSLTTPGGKAAEVSGGTFGWSIDEAAETTALIASIKAGEHVVRQPAYVQRGISHEGNDWGSTYIEVDISSQYMWYVVDGTVVLETAVATGDPLEGLDTPTGVYTILLMQAPSVLVGNIMPDTGEPEYRTPVRNWMQITWGGVGFHDADWQPTFGGSWYMGNGSHGCINMPVDMARTLYSMVGVGTPAVIHY